jgi:hypothetical protein
MALWMFIELIEEGSELAGKKQPGWLFSQLVDLMKDLISQGLPVEIVDKSRFLSLIPELKLVGRKRTETIHAYVRTTFDARTGLGYSRRLKEGDWAAFKVITPKEVRAVTERVDGLYGKLTLWTVMLQSHRAYGTRLL